MRKDKNFEGGRKEGKRCKQRGGFVTRCCLSLLVTLAEDERQRKGSTSHDSDIINNLYV